MSIVRYDVDGEVVIAWVDGVSKGPVVPRKHDSG
jgi:hypothetical protein